MLNYNEHVTSDKPAALDNLKYKLSLEKILMFADGDNQIGYNRNWLKLN